MLRPSMNAALFAVVGWLAVAPPDDPPSEHAESEAEAPGATTSEGPRAPTEPEDETNAAAEAAELEARETASAAFLEGVQAFEREDYETAIVAFEHADALVPHPHTRFNLGLALDLAGRTEEARERYQRVTELDPNNQEAWRRLAP